MEGVSSSLDPKTSVDSALYVDWNMDFGDEVNNVYTQQDRHLPECMNCFWYSCTGKWSDVSSW